MTRRTNDPSRKEVRNLLLKYSRSLEKLRRNLMEGEGEEEVVCLER